MSTKEHGYIIPIGASSKSERGEAQAGKGLRGGSQRGAIRRVPHFVDGQVRRDLTAGDST
jgi:hypothetical protein